MSAGEIGVYTVCPESWKLRVIKGIRGEKSDSIEKGEDLHRQWAADHAEALFFDRGVKLIVILIAVCILLVGILLNDHNMRWF